MNPKSVLKYASEQGAKFVSTRFTDLPGSWQHLTFPIDELNEDSFEDGFGFDASSIRGWAAIHESDMLMVPDSTRFWMDPFSAEPTLCIVSNAVCSQPILDARDLPLIVDVAATPLLEGKYPFSHPALRQ